MLNEQLLEPLNFRQEGDSCVLAGYAVAAYPFTGQSVRGYFSDYCRHFHIRHTNAERAYAAYFPGEYKRRKITGFELIRALHNGSKQRCFSRCRRKFWVELIKDVKVVENEIVAELGASVPNALLVFLNTERHSVVVFVGNGGLSFYQTRAGEVGDGLRN